VINGSLRQYLPGVLKTELPIPLKNQKINGVVIIVQEHVISVVKPVLIALKQNVRHAVPLVRICIADLL
jgi:hypothetical protein